MPGDFSERLNVLREQVGSRHGSITGRVEVDQIYAAYQHNGLDLHHPRGGQALYLQAPLMRNFRRYLQHYASTVIEGDGGIQAMIDSVDDLAGRGGVATHAPVEFGDLRRSGHPSVLAGLRLVYDRSPEVHRLTEQELRAKARLRYMPPQLLGWIWWHVMHKTKPPPRRH